MRFKLMMKAKLISAFLLVGLVPFAVIGLTALTNTGTEIKSQAFQKLSAVREIKKSGVERYFNTIRDQVITLSEDTMIIDAMQEFIVAMKSFREENSLSDEQLTSMGQELKTYYDGQFAPEYEKQNDGAKADINSIFSNLDKDTIGDMDTVSAGIAASVEEQGAATSEIARNVEQAASGTKEVSSNIDGVSEAITETGSAASQITGAAGELSQQSELLKSEVAKFLNSLREGPAESQGSDDPDNEEAKPDKGKAKQKAA